LRDPRTGAPLATDPDKGSALKKLYDAGLDEKALMYFNIRSGEDLTVSTVSAVLCRYGMDEKQSPLQVGVDHEPDELYRLIGSRPFDRLVPHG
jgi:hypothetical protein